jgi:hypothetical protein
MPNQVRALRSSTSQNRPTGRLPGELYVNFADNQLGTINPANTATDLIAVRYFSPTANYFIGDHIIYSGILYRAIYASNPGPFIPANWSSLGGSVDLDSVPPVNPQIGQLWFDSVGGQLYVYYDDGNTSQWVIAVNSGAGISDAPTDNTTYARNNGAWVNLKHTDITDWTAALAPYALTTAVPVPGGNPLMDGTVSAGTAATWSRSDHVHPVDTSRYAASNPSGFQTAAQVSAGLATKLNLTGGTLTGILATPQINVTNAVNCASLISSQFSRVGETLQVISLGSDAALTFLDGSSAARGQLLWQATTGSLVGFNPIGGGTYALDQGTSFTISGQGLKPGGGAWVATSDARIKTVQGDYAKGLDDVLALRPVTFVYKGNDTPTEDAADTLRDLAPTNAAPFPASPHYRPAVEGQEFVGLVAQEVEAIFPGMVTTRAAFIDGEPVDDLRTLDVSPLIYALVNAVKTLAARVEALEATQ